MTVRRLALAIAFSLPGFALAQIGAGQQSALIDSGSSFAQSLLPSAIATTDSGTAPSPVAGAPGASQISAQSALPNYTTNQQALVPSTASGTSLMTMGVNEMNRCAGYSNTGNAADDQQCAAVNFLANRSPSGQFVLQPNDPMLQAQNQSIDGATDTASPGASCIPVVKTTPGKYQTVQCSESSIADDLVCLTTLNPSCAFAGSAIKSQSITSSGNCSTPSLSPTGTSGQYTYNFGCGGSGDASGWAEINFQLDSVGEGSYISVTLGSLDDAAAVGVNGYTVYAGYPNNGPQYMGAPFFPLGAGNAFQLGYSWVGPVTQTDYGNCTNYSYDGDGGQYCASYATYTVNQGMWANTKLLDFCPPGYGYVEGSPQGFFCNSEGKFLMNSHEGADYRNVSLSSQMPLVVGMNKVQIFWGTRNPGINGGSASGGVGVWGTIYNIAPLCDQPWIDDCQMAAQASQGAGPATSTTGR